MKDKKAEFIRLKGVRQNNLKGFDLDIPLGGLTVVTGLSGTGKSSLVFETLHAEGQRRYVETFSPYTRQFLEIMDRPDLDEVENIRPSIAIQQSNSVKTSRSTVGTMTELTDYFKIWFCHVASLYDPETGDLIEADNPGTIWKKVFKKWKGKEVLVCFEVHKPENMEWEELLEPLQAQGYTRGVVNKKVVRLESLTSKTIKKYPLLVVQDRVKVAKGEEARFLESAGTAMHFGNHELQILSTEGKLLGQFSEGLHSPKTKMTFNKPRPALFSFNSPIGACPECKGFGRTIEIDYNLVIPDKDLSIKDGAIRPFHGEVYGECLKELLHHAKKKGVRTHVPWKKLNKKEKAWILDGDPEFIKDTSKWESHWYGVKGFFDWLETRTYKMHIRFVLAKYRSYNTCPKCEGQRLKDDALNWKWKQKTLPDLYNMSVRDLLKLMKRNYKETGNHPVDLAAESIVTRLSYLEQVGLGYLTLNRTSRTLSGGEVERVNLTTCLGTSLVDTLFVLDEPSIGLHSRDISRLIKILRHLTDMGNTVVVVEHDESIMRAADTIIEMGPKPGAAGGQVVFSGKFNDLLKDKESITGQYLSGKKDITLPYRRRSKVRKKQAQRLEFKGVTANNIQDENFTIPLGQFVCLTGVSGSGKSTLLNNVIHQGLLSYYEKPTEDLAEIKEILSNIEVPRSELVDQSPVSKTPRSNPALYIDAWDEIRQLFAKGLMGSAEGMRPSHFSFNSGSGRCDHCSGLGCEKVEMQFLSDVYITCPVCDGKRFKEDVLAIKWNHKNIAEVLAMDVEEASMFFRYYPKVVSKLQALKDVGLGYLTLGQPLNTLSGGECQRLKLVKYLTQLDDSEEKKLLLLDEPTTGLHRSDIQYLVNVLQKIVSKGHSLLVIEHHMDIIKSADWIIEMGPDAGDEGGEVVAQGTPEQIARTKTETAPYLNDVLSGKPTKYRQEKIKTQIKRQESLKLVGAREHNLKNVTVEIPHKKISVVTGVSGSGKSSLAFDIIFAEGQRRFMESISAYARQFIEQMSRPDIDELTGVAPTVAIEQRVTRGSRKSTVATVTEVAQYLRLLYAKLGVQYSPKSNQPVVSMGVSALAKNIEGIIKKELKSDALYLCAPLIRGRKGHHQPLANWADAQGYETLRIDGKLVRVDKFKPLDRFKEHDIEVVISNLLAMRPLPMYRLMENLEKTLELGKQSCAIVNEKSKLISWLSTKRTDPVTGEAFPELDPKHFSWNSPKGWCPTCHGHGYYMDWMRNNIDYEEPEHFVAHGEICPNCNGERLNEVSRHVKLHLKGGKAITLPQLLGLTPNELLATLDSMDLDRRGKEITKDLIPQIRERLRFMGDVGLDYLTLDRSSNTLSGGEAQRIRLAAQLSSNLSGVLYVLDEPSIGLHARDNNRLIESLKELRDRGNTLLVVEHDEDTMRESDNIIDLGPDAGVHGGELLASGKWNKIKKNKKSLTGKYLNKTLPHPSRGKYRELPKAYNSRKKKGDPEWLVMKEASLRNLKGDDLTIPLGKLVMVCGISGAGKSTLIRDALRPGVEAAIENKAEAWKGKDSGFKEILNGNVFKKVIEVDQEPIGKTPRSTPATYIGAFDIVRDYYATLPDAKIHGLTKSHFSFNTKAGRCEKCAGAGRIKLEMNFLPDTFVTCEECNGTRYAPELNEIRWNEKNISDALNMSFVEAAEFFSFHNRLKGLMELMNDTGLGYLTLGQSSPSLSGGEAQRLKLVTELAKGLPTLKERTFGLKPKNLYILEEPTIGLHMRDCERLINILHRLVDQGHTVVVIEHNLDLLAEADYIVEVGPDGGEQGGEILYQGELKGLLKCKKSPTAPFLKSKVGK